MMQTKEIISSI